MNKTRNLKEKVNRTSEESLSKRTENQKYVQGEETNYQTKSEKKTTTSTTDLSEKQGKKSVKEWKTQTGNANENQYEVKQAKRKKKKTNSRKTS